MRNITIVCSDLLHPIYPLLKEWATKNSTFLNILIVNNSVDIVDGGDFLFLISCHEIIPSSLRIRFKYILVVHASDLPAGRGMSPHIWQILEGKKELIITLLDAADQLDAGDIWMQECVYIPSTALHDEINHIIFMSEIRLIEWALVNCETKSAYPQKGASSYYRKRTHQDSQIGIDATFKEAFNLLRVADPVRFPAFIEYEGVRFKIILERY